MKYKLSVGIILSFFICAFIPFSYGYENEGPFSEKERVINETLNRWELGIEVSHITYKEPGVMKEKGLMYGFAGSYTYRGWIPPAPEELDRWMLKLEGRFSFGEVDYEGALSGGTPYTIDDIDDYVWEIRGLVGYDFPIFAASTITPFTGIGYRYLNDDPSFDPYGYERESNYVYSPVGIELITSLDNGWSAEAIVEYDIFWRGKQISHLSDLDPGFNDPENTQKRGYGVRGSVKLIKKCRKLDFLIEPFIRYWNIKRSKYARLTYYGSPTTQVVYEPKNTSTEFGVKFATRF